MWIADGRFGEHPAPQIQKRDGNSRVPPVLVIHGDADRVVPWSNGRDIAAALDRDGRLFCPLVTLKVAATKRVIRFVLLH